MRYSFPRPFLTLLCVVVFGCAMGVASAEETKTDAVAPGNPFSNQWDKAPIGGSFKMDDYIIWGASVIQGDDGRYYMFASRWPKKTGMDCWVTNSEVVLASSDKLAGPYKYEQSVLPPRGPEFWDGCATHNPSIHKYKGQYVLFYIGVRYYFSRPDGTQKLSQENYGKAWNAKRIGVATAPSPQGPWKRMEKPILETNPDGWDAAITSNPAATILADGSVFLIYKSAPVPYPARLKNRALHFGAVRADNILGPYKKLTEDRFIKINGRDASVEDPYIWHDGNNYLMVAKAMDRKLIPAGSGFMAWSKNGLDWTLTDPALAYNMSVEWTDGTKTTLLKKERPQVFLEKGKTPRAVFFATRDKKGDIYNAVVPLKVSPETVLEKKAGNL
ncbi:MAG: glycoside hydrolase family protein [Puniceicoccales bacterium]|nr:glycoside hydrolase family protein [Puniceicoccales bacterium]